MTHSECVSAASYWLNAKCDVVLPEFFSHNAELPDAIGFRTGGKSLLIECKVSRGDFLSDKKKSFRFRPERGMGDLRYYCCPSGLIKPTEVPYGWGLIYVYPSGHVKQVKEATFQPKNVEAEHHLLFYYARRAVFSGAHKSILAFRSVF
ncbi:hypothetical protein SAMN04487914_108104 [Arthrobacter sp. ok909]|uniref:hypothetical protein n=1 Tax=Arthrobacter sp. ok909 TaxID=1761746 RepID=UPI0008888F97|nr:hypothetical protein [Arthrobacter sp. ok909]SDP33513.1 hypothetical protein SAMN04487914_108104 [Arthrobacter sp. ok909]